MALPQFDVGSKAAALLDLRLLAGRYKKELAAQLPPLKRRKLESVAGELMRKYHVLAAFAPDSPVPFLTFESILLTINHAQRALHDHE